MREKVISAMKLEAGRRSDLELATGKSRSEKSLCDIATQIAPNCRGIAVQATEQGLVPLPVSTVTHDMHYFVHNLLIIPVSSFKVGWEARSVVDGRVFFVNHST